MHVALLQYPIYLCDKAQNIGQACEHLRAIAGQADIAVLPELFSTGFCPTQTELAEAVDGQTMCTMQQVVDETGIAVAGTFMCREGEDLYNRGFFLSPQCAPQWCDKAHLYAHGGEDQVFRRGRSRSMIEYKGVRIRLLTCYDLRFPVWARNQAPWYDLLLVVANWPEVRIAAWDVLTRARAIENQCYLVGVNMLGEDAMGLHYCGHSVAIDTRMHDLAQLADNEAGTRIVDLDMAVLHHYREALPLWKDNDVFDLQ